MDCTKRMQTILTVFHFHRSSVLSTCEEKDALSPLIL